MGWGFFNKEEKERIQNQNLRNDGSGDRFDVLNEAEQIELQNLLQEQREAEYNFWRENTETSEESAINDEEYGYDWGLDTDNNSQNEEKTDVVTRAPYRNPLRKIAGGRVLQYPIDLNTDLQDYFEIQVFKYRPAGGLPGIKDGNQGYGQAYTSGGYLGQSNRRGNRQNFRLQDLQSTIQLPMPPSIKDMNAVDFAGGTMSGLAAAMFGPTVQAFLGKGEKGNAFDSLSGENEVKNFRQKAQDFLGGLLDTGQKTWGALRDAAQNKGFRRVTTLNAIAQAVAAIGVNIDVDQAITRASGAVKNPNLELLFKGPALRSFSFNIRLTPRDADESKRVRMIIRVLKQHSAAKKNPQIFENDDAELGANFLLGTPDVFKLRYIKAKTQRDIKGLNKFKTCALTSVSVDYTGEVGRFAAYEEDSQPVTTIISLNFTELTPIYDQDYAEFTNDDDVGM